MSPELSGQSGEGGCDLIKKTDKCKPEGQTGGGGGGGGGALLERRGEGGRGEGGSPPAKMNHIQQELQKCTTLTHLVNTFVIMSEDRCSTHLFGSMHCALT